MPLNDSNRAPMIHNTTTTVTTTSPNIAVTLPMPSYLQNSFPFATYPPSSTNINLHQSTSFLSSPLPSAIFTNTAGFPNIPKDISMPNSQQNEVSKGKKVVIDEGDKENCNPNKVFKRQINAESLRSVLKRCRSNTTSSHSGPDPNLLVADLITEHRTWDMISLETNFNQADIDRVLSIPLSLYPHDDVLIWNQSFTGVYNSCFLSSAGVFGMKGMHFTMGIQFAHQLLLLHMLHRI
ncbi:hypothetical protein G4B88_020260 [Cannabis sativa]|uniref:Uncharacterized protein n=1 Tax=Cannabis sativa TaxID=3483 RepID=A0A7J6DNG8_CANSA|nr:hypothetical protein G4B88_020260 [Cannabis sativa]